MTSVTLHSSDTVIEYDFVQKCYPNLLYVTLHDSDGQAAFEYHGELLKRISHVHNMPEILNDALRSYALRKGLLVQRGEKFVATGQVK